MMRRTMILALAIAGCNGGGESTTAAETVAGTSTGNNEETATPEDTVTPATDETSTPDTGTTEDTTEDTADTGPLDTSAGEESSSGGTTGGCEDVAIVGSWLSEGDNVAPLLVDVLMIESITAVFEEATFQVTSTDVEGNMGEQTGTWTSELCPGSETKYHIVLEQTAPSAITVEGIYEVDGCMDPAVMRYEVIQTQPDLGAPAPTCDDDFGTGPFGADNVQVFVRQ